MHGIKRKRTERLRIATAAVERMRQETSASPTEIAATLQLVVDQLNRGLDPNDERMLVELVQALKDAGAPLDEDALALLDQGNYPNGE